MAQMDPAKRPVAAAAPAPVPAAALAAKPPVATTAAPKGAAGPIVPMSPSKERLVKEDEVASRSAPASPATPGTTETRALHNISPGERGSNLKAEAYGDAHLKRVETEAKIYIDGEVRKAEALCERMKAVADKTKMKEEARAIETLKKEENRADSLVQAAILKADKIVAEAKQNAVQIKAVAKERCEKHIAESTTRADSEKAAHDESKSRRMAEIKDKAETMIAAGETIPPTVNKSVSTSIKQKFGCVTPATAA